MTTFKRLNIWCLTVCTEYTTLLFLYISGVTAIFFAPNIFNKKNMI